MTGHVQPVRALGPEAEAAWRSLGARAAQPNPLFEPACLLPAARHLPNGSDILLVTAEEDGRWYGCFPVQRLAGWRALPRPVLMTDVRRMTYDATPLLDPDRAAEAWAAMLDAVGAANRTHASLPGVVVFYWLDEGPVADHLAESCRRAGLPHRVYDSWERPVLLRSEDGDYRHAHSKKSLYNLTRSSRRLSDLLGTEVRLVDRSDDPGAVEVLLGLEDAGYKGRNGVALLTRSGEPEWFRQMCDRFREDGRLAVYALSAGDRVVALQLMLRAGDGMFLLKVAYDESLRHFSPGNQLSLAAAERFHSSGAAWLDTCTYEGNETLLRLYPDRRRLSTVVVATGGLADRTAVRGVAVARRVLGRSRSHRPPDGSQRGRDPGYLVPGGAASQGPLATAR